MAVFKIIVIYYNFGVPVLAGELAMACVCVCPTQFGVLSKRGADRACFGMDASFDQSYTVL